jgi:hypothetical protein
MALALLFPLRILVRKSRKNFETSFSMKGFNLADNGE